MARGSARGGPSAAALAMCKRRWLCGHLSAIDNDFIYCLCINMEVTVLNWISSDNGGWRRPRKCRLLAADCTDHRLYNSRV